MSPPDPVAAAEDGRALADLNRWLERQKAPDRIAWALSRGAENHALSSSFGAQSVEGHQRLDLLRAFHQLSACRGFWNRLA